MKLRLIAMVLVSVLASAGSTQQPKQAGLLVRAVGCLAAQSWALEDLRGVGVSRGERIAVRFTQETIPDTSPETPEKTKMLLMNPAGSKGWLFFFKSEANGSITLDRNAYRVERSGNSWTAAEGNGGIATYKAIAAYTAILARSSPVELRLSPAPQRCRTE
jgi:hypothetical protein